MEEEGLMFSLVRLIPLRRLLQEQVPALAVSFIIAELFYKFHSFTLETLAFLATWGVVDAVIQLVRHLAGGVETATVNGTRR
jgi:hypothetical protein